jgi:hypothetical protein
MLKTEPAPFMSAKAAKLVTAATSRTISRKIADCDWIVEAVMERLDVKQALYRKLDAVRGPAPRCPRTPRPFRCTADRGLSDAFKRDFLITHFLQSAALHAAAGDRHRAETPIRNGRRRRRVRDRARQEHRALQGQPRLHRQSPRRLLAAGRGHRSHRCLG